MTKTLKLNDRYQIQSDRYNYVLQEFKKIKKEDSENLGEEYTEDIGFYSNLRALIQALGEREIREGIDDLKEVLKSLEELKNTVKELDLITIKR